MTGIFYVLFLLIEGMFLNRSFDTGHDNSHLPVLSKRVMLTPVNGIHFMEFGFYFIKLFIRDWEGCGWILELLNIKATVVLGYIFSYSAYQSTEKLVYHGNLNRLPKVIQKSNSQSQIYAQREKYSFNPWLIPVIHKVFNR